VKNLRLLTILLVGLITNELLGQTNKDHINGISVLGSYEPVLNIEMFENIKMTNASWIALIPEEILDRETLTFIPDSEYRNWGNTIEAQIKAIKLAKKAGFNIFIKPHIILEKIDKSPPPKLGEHLYTRYSKKEDKTKGASWRGTFKAKNEADWNLWETTYENYILELAEIAATYDVELFSLGTELKAFVVNRPQFWNQLIQKVRKIYKGDITYSANWDEYDKVSFWSQLDYIGVDAYFPINITKTPSIQKTVKNWNPIKEKLKTISETNNKKILLTEFGYRNVSFAGLTPWTHDKGKSKSNYDAQSNLYEAFFRSFWNEPWIAGGFSWNWLHDLKDGDNTDFSLQYKPAMTVLQDWYK